MGDDDKSGLTLQQSEQGEGGNAIGSFVTQLRDQVSTKESKGGKDSDSEEGDDDSDAESEGSEDAEEDSDSDSDDGDDEGGDSEDDEGGDTDAEGDEDEEESDEEDDEEDDEDEDEDDEEESDDDEDEESTAGKDDRTAPKTPIFAVTADGRRIKIPADASLMIKVDGKEKPVNIHKAVSEFNGRFMVDKEKEKAYSMQREVAAEKAKYDQVGEQYKEIDRVVGAAFEKLNKGEGLESYHELVMLTGKYKDPVEWEIAHLKEMIPLAQEIAAMDVDEQNNWIKSRRLAYLERKDAAEAQAKKVDPVRAQVQAEIKQVRKAHAITDDEWSEGEATLAAVRKAGKLADFGITQVTPAVCADLVLTKRAADRADKALSTFPKLGNRIGEKKLQEIHGLLVEAAKSYGAGEDELNAILQEAVSDLKGDADKDRTDAEKIGKRFKNAKPPNKATANPNKKKKPPVRSFEEMRERVNRSRERFS